MHHCNIPSALDWTVASGMRHLQSPVANGDNLS